MLEFPIPHPSNIYIVTHASYSKEWQNLPVRQEQQTKQVNIKHQALQVLNLKHHAYGYEIHENIIHVRK